MSESTDNTTELDSYGVWVKRPGAAEEPISDNLDIDAMFDIPDFPETEITDSEANDNISEDIFTEEDVSLDESEPEVSDNSFEDMGDISIPETSEGDIDLSAFETSEESQDTPSIMENPVTGDDFQEDFQIEESAENFTDTDNNNIDITENSDEDSDISSDFELPEEDGEISLDEFMDEGFSDESVASGNNGFAPGEEPKPVSTETEEISMDDFSDGEISLDDFLDGGEFATGPAPEVKVQEEIVDEKPLEMDISFDKSVENIETEDNIQTDETFDEEDNDNTYEDTTTVNTETEDTFRSTEVTGDTEDIDLSDFGIDANAEETPITQNVEESKSKDTVVDYDLCVSDERMTSAPVVEEVRDSESEEINNTNNESSETSTSATVSQPIAQTNENTELLQQIINELSGMKAEINALKSDLEQIQNQKNEAPYTEEAIIPETNDDDSSGFFDDSDGDETIALSGDELDNMLNGVEITEASDITQTEDNTETDEDNTIEFDTPDVNESEEPSIESSNESEALTENETDSTFEENSVIEETVFEEPVIEETSVEESIFEESPAEESIEENEPEITEDSSEEIIIPETKDDDSTGFFDDTDGDDTIALSGDELDNMLNGVEITEASEEQQITDNTEEESENFQEEEIDQEPEDDIPEEIDIEPVSTDTVEDDIFGSVDDSDLFGSDDDSISFEDENAASDSDEILEEPNLDDIKIEEEDDDDLPDEISIPKENDVDSILVESSNDDFMDSVKDNTIEEPVMNDSEIEENVEKVDDFDEFMAVDTDEESLTESNIDYLSEDAENDDEGDFPSVDIFGSDDNNETLDEENTEETPETSEPSIEEEQIIDESEIQIEETSVSENEVNAVDDHTDNPVNENTGDNDDLKKDIKSVLLYMDQLLENLPEEKIVEFAKSDEFTTYKKLFSELGLA